MNDQPENPEPENRVVIPVEDAYRAGERLDVFVTARLPKISRSRVRKLINEGRVTLDDRTAKPSAVVTGGSVVVVVFPHPPRPPAAPENIPLDILFEDDWLVVINKPPGMVVHPAAGHHSGTLVNALLGRYNDLPGTENSASHRPGIVHRLDKDTSGVLVVARDEWTMTRLGRLFHEHNIEREYEALVWGDPPSSGTIDAPIARSPRNRKKFAVIEGGRRAVTHWTAEERFGFLTRVRVTLETGRTHQIRVHLSSRGWPVVADPTYGGGLHGIGRLSSRERETARQVLKVINRQALHARMLGFEHPDTGKQVRFEAPLPEEFRRVLQFLRKEA